MVPPTKVAACFLKKMPATMGVGMTNLLIQASVEKRPGFEAGMSNLEMIVVRPAWISRRGRGGLVR